MPAQKGICMLQATAAGRYRQGEEVEMHRFSNAGTEKHVGGLERLEVDVAVEEGRSVSERQRAHG